MLGTEMTTTPDRLKEPYRLAQRGEGVFQVFEDVTEENGVKKFAL